MGLVNFSADAIFVKNSADEIFLRLERSDEDSL